MAIRKTYPLEPHFYIVKLGYAGVYLFFLFLLQNIDCGHSLELPRRGGSNEYPQSVLSKNKKNIKKFFFCYLKKSLYIAWASFRNAQLFRVSWSDEETRFQIGEFYLVKSD